MEQIFGTIERITFQNHDSGFTVAQLKEPKKADTTCIVGSMPSLQPGESVRCFGKWKRHLVHGNQFEVSEHRIEMPADLNGIKKYLGSGLIKGIGKVYAKKIVERFGLDTLEVIDKDPKKLLEIAGLGAKRVKTIAACWSDQKSVREVMIFLQSNGVSPAYAQKIYKTYGNQCIKKVQENPYTLARDVIGIGFKTADKIAAEMGIEKNSIQRIDSGIEFVLGELSNEGNVCYPVTLFIQAASEILEVVEDRVQERINILEKEQRIAKGELVYEGVLQEFIWFIAFYRSETGIAKEIKRLKYGKPNLRKIHIEKAIDWVQDQLNIQLGINQKTAVGQALKGKLEIITGGPGTGKSTITKAILHITEKLTDKILLAAPTGRAAKRMTEITGKKAYTIHSLLEFDFRGGGFKKNRQSPLDCDLIIIDEASMIDTLLMYSLLKAIPDRSRVIFVGDINQLPSVGPGNVLKDMITSQCIPVTQLNDIFRQAAGSRIVTNAHMINKGTLPDISNPQGSDFFFIDSEDPEKALQNILTLVTTRIPKKYRFNPFDEIQVLAPMKKGILGTENLNTVLQERLNPDKDYIYTSGKKLSIGDKVMQVRNNYDKKVYNGDVGRIQRINGVEQELHIRFDGNDVIYDFSDLDEIVLAYAVSVHKYQGSECHCVVIPIHTSHFKLLHRNLLYTAVTRGKQLVVLVGSKKAIGIAVRNDEVKKRYTGLLSALIETLNPFPEPL